LTVFWSVAVSGAVHVDVLHLSVDQIWFEYNTEGNPGTYIKDSKIIDRNHATFKGPGDGDAFVLP